MSEDILSSARLNQVSRLDSFELHNMHDLIVDAIDANRYLADQKGVIFDNRVDPVVQVLLSKPYASLIFRNLINNSVKYNSPKGKVTIDASEDEQMVSISITDTGVGVDQKDLEKIWDEFYIGDPARGDPLSKGLGLPIVKKVVKLHQGTVHCQSMGFLKGSTFTVNLPKEIR